MQKFHSHGKLLISGEYVVLDGATALALPTSYGQTMQVQKTQAPVLKWKSLDEDGSRWFEENFKLEELRSSKVPEEHQKNGVSKMLFLTLSFAAQQNPEAFSGTTGWNITSKIDFPRDWGLGTSSTLIANLAKWLKIDAFKLLEQTFGGSGYDIAVAMEENAITFEKQGPENSILKTSFDPPFKDQLFFVHLNQKQNSRDSIKLYREQDKKTLTATIEKISGLTHQMITCTELQDFELLIEVHENLISKLLGLQKVKSRLFPEYKGAVKSLGGWGGDFVLATGSVEDMDYFKDKGYTSVIPYEQMILS